MFTRFGLLLEVLRIGIVRLVEEYGLDLEATHEAELEQATQNVFCVQTGHYRAWVSTFHGDVDCYYVDDMDVAWT